MAAPQIPRDFMENFPKPVKTYHRDPYPRIDPKTSSFQGTGKTVLVTAGGTGIGFEISRAFAATGVARICILARRQEPLTKAKAALEKEFSNIKIDTFSASLSDFAAVTALMKQIGRIDVLALSAAWTPGGTYKLAEIALGDLESAFDTNVIGNMNLIQAVLANRSDKTKQTCIINVSSWAAYRPLPAQALYGSSKAAFAQLMTEFANEIDEKEARFVSYHPGAVYTEAAAVHFQKDWFDGWEDAALPGQFAVWLASPEADFLNGRFLWAEWDVNELIEAKERILADPFLLKISLVQ